jgi:hypothetical protein
MVLLFDLRLAFSSSSAGRSNKFNNYLSNAFLSVLSIIGELSSCGSLFFLFGLLRCCVIWLQLFVGKTLVMYKTGCMKYYICINLLTYIVLPFTSFFGGDIIIERTSKKLRKKNLIKMFMIFLLLIIIIILPSLL